MSNKEPTPDKPKFKDPESIKDEHVYAFLTSYYLHQDELSWSRMEALGVVEIGVLTAAFAKEGWIAVVTLSVGSIVIWLIWCLVQRDWEIRDQFLKGVLDAVHSPRNIRMTYKPKGWWWQGEIVLRAIVYILLLTNIVLAEIFFCQGYGMR